MAQPTVDPVPWPYEKSGERKRGSVVGPSVVGQP
jgi:hypothetical protein